MPDEVVTLVGSGHISADEYEDVRAFYRARKWNDQQIYSQIRYIKIGEGCWFEFDSLKEAERVRNNILAIFNRKARRRGRNWYISTVRKGKKIFILKKPIWMREMGSLPVEILDKEAYNKVMEMVGKPPIKDPYGAIMYKGEGNDT